MEVIGILGGILAVLVGLVWLAFPFIVIAKLNTLITEVKAMNQRLSRTNQKLATMADDEGAKASDPYAGL